MLKTKNSKSSLEKSIDIDPSKTIAVVSFDVNQSPQYLNAIKLLDSKGEIIAEHRWHTPSGTWISRVIPEGEEIIGIYINSKSTRAFI